MTDTLIQKLESMMRMTPCNGCENAYEKAIALIREHVTPSEIPVLTRDDFMRFVIHVNGELGDFTRINQYAADRLYEMFETFFGHPKQEAQPAGEMLDNEPVAKVVTTPAGTHQLFVHCVLLGSGVLADTKQAFENLAALVNVMARQPKRESGEGAGLLLGRAYKAICILMVSALKEADVKDLEYGENVLDAITAYNERNSIEDGSAS